MAGTSFCNMAENKDDELLDSDTVFSSERDKAEWEWKTSQSTKKLYTKANVNSTIKNMKS